MKKQLLIAISIFPLLTACDVFEDSKNAVEQQYLSEHQAISEVITQIRAHGLNAIETGKASSSVAQCIVSKLEADPMGRLIELEGTLQESANIADLINSMSQLTEQEISLASIPDLLNQGANTLSYLRHLLKTYELTELKAQISELLDEGKNTSQDIGAHLRGIIEQCE